jgi:glutamyl-tRNA synthetase
MSTPAFDRPVRVRFAPSPTGPLHMGGVRTAFYNWLFAKRHGGTFILRIEDTDRTRFVDGAEAYIEDALTWCGISPEESPTQPGQHGPYRQSERGNIYAPLVQQLLESGHAYKAWDTPEEIQARRNSAESSGTPFQYDAASRGSMRNSLSLSKDDVAQLNAAEAPFVVRFKMPANEAVTFTDAIRDAVTIDTAVLDDKVLMKADGLPTYHLANVVDDHFMEISHVIRGEEWLPSAPLHQLLYRAFDWTPPTFAHLPLILKPAGNGKLSKRDGDKGRFPVFPLRWVDPATGNESNGYRESGYLPEAFMNMLLLLGWNPGTEQELFSLEEAATAFDLNRVIKSGARFNPDKAKWFNEQHLRSTPVSDLVPNAQALFATEGADFNADQTSAILEMMLERIAFLEDLKDATWLHTSPTEFNAKLIKKRWKDDTDGILSELAKELRTVTPFEADPIEAAFKAFLERKELGFGQVLLPFRIALTGEGGGPSMFAFAAFLGKEITLDRLNKGMARIAQQRTKS